MAASSTFAMLGNAVVSLDGMSIGGAMSSAAVSTRFAEEESKAFVGKKHVDAGFGALSPKDVAWIRYVDDILAASNSICGSCLLQFVALLYSERTSVVYNSDEDFHSPCIWLHLALYYIRDRICWTLKNTNREYMFGNRTARFQTQFVPWPGKLPCHFKQLRGILISKMSVAWSAHIPSMSVAICLLETLLELLRSHYPLSLLRAVYRAGRQPFLLEVCSGPS